MKSDKHHLDKLVDQLVITTWLLWGVLFLMFVCLSKIQESKHEAETVELEYQPSSFIYDMHSDKILREFEPTSDAIVMSIGNAFDNSDEPEHKAAIATDTDAGMSTPSDAVAALELIAECAEESTESLIPEGPKLSQFCGVFSGPSGKETYYNLDMSRIVSIMRSMGYDEEEYPYWVREDGVKMLGPYVMVAAELSSRPKGTILECSLGTAIVVDTGGFASSNPTQLDIATAW